MSDFRYQRLMEIKEKLLEQKQQRLEEALAAVREVLGEVEKTDEEIRACYKTLAEECMTGTEFSVLTNYLHYLDVRKSGLLEEKERRYAAVESIRAELQTLAIELKMLEKLKARTVARLKKARNKKEQKLMDDLAIRIETR